MINVHYSIVKLNYLLTPYQYLISDTFLLIPILVAHVVIKILFRNTKFVCISFVILFSTFPFTLRVPERSTPVLCSLPAPGSIYFSLASEVDIITGSQDPYAINFYTSANVQIKTLQAKKYSS